MADAMSMLDVIARFATTGEIDLLRIGMDAAEVWTVLGVPPEGLEGNFKIDSLDFALEDGSLSYLGLEHLGDLTFVMPEVGVGVRVGSREPSRFSYTEVLSRLELDGCAWDPEPLLTFPDQTIAICTMQRVGLTFSAPSEWDLEDELTEYALANIGITRR